MTNKINERGITLVALVITIVILIILATVAISFAFNGGLIPYAEKAKEVGEQDSANVTKALQEMEAKLNKALVDAGITL